MRNRTNALALGALLASTALVSPALAQTGPAQRFATIDENGVDLTTGQFFWSLTEGTIGWGDARRLPAAMAQPPPIPTTLYRGSPRWPRI